jgi:hypothetical protein
MQFSSVPYVSRQVGVRRHKVLDLINVLFIISRISYRKAFSMRITTADVRGAGFATVIYRHNKYHFTTSSWRVLPLSAQFVTVISRNVITMLLYAESYVMSPFQCREPGWLSRYSDWLRTGWPRGWSSSPGRVKYVLFYMSRSALGPTKPPIYWVPGIKRPGLETDLWTATRAKAKKMWIYPFPHTPSWLSA